MNTYSGLNLNQDKATKPQTVQMVRQGEATLYWFLLIHYKTLILKLLVSLIKQSKGQMPYPCFYKRSACKRGWFQAVLKFVFFIVFWSSEKVSDNFFIFQPQVLQFARHTINQLQYPFVQPPFLVQDVCFQRHADLQRFFLTVCSDGWFVGFYFHEINRFVALRQIGGYHAQSRQFLSAQCRFCH